MCTYYIANNIYPSSRDDFSDGLLHFLQLASIVPESRLGYDLVWRKYAHLVERRISVFIRWKFPTDNLILAQLKISNTRYVASKILKQKFTSALHLRPIPVA